MKKVASEKCPKRGHTKTDFQTFYLAHIGFLNHLSIDQAPTDVSNGGSYATYKNHMA